MKKIEFLGSLYDEHSRWGVHSVKGLSPTLTSSMGMGGVYVPMIIEKGKPKMPLDLIREKKNE